MISLVLTACLLHGSQECKHVSVPMDAKATMDTCLIMAHQNAVDWRAKHGDYMVVGWHCNDPSHPDPTRSASNAGGDDTWKPIHEDANPPSMKGQ